ncbi:MAG: hypothetical protein P8Y93_06555 [Acidobacteriota bacterium]
MKIFRMLSGPGALIDRQPAGAPQACEGTDRRPDESSLSEGGRFVTEAVGVSPRRRARESGHGDGDGDGDGKIACLKN